MLYHYARLILNIGVDFMLQVSWGEVKERNLCILVSSVVLASSVTNSLPATATQSPGENEWRKNYGTLQQLVQISVYAGHVRSISNVMLVKRDTNPDGCLEWNRPRISKCIIASCTERNTIIHTSIATNEKISELLGMEVLNEPNQLLTPLCPHHYNKPIAYYTQVTICTLRNTVIHAMQ